MRWFGFFGVAWLKIYYNSISRQSGISQQHKRDEQIDWICEWSGVVWNGWLVAALAHSILFFLSISALPNELNEEKRRIEELQRPKEWMSEFGWGCLACCGLGAAAAALLRNKKDKQQHPTKWAVSLPAENSGIDWLAFLLLWGGLWAAQQPMAPPKRENRKSQSIQGLSLLWLMEGMSGVANGIQLINEEGAARMSQTKDKQQEVYASVELSFGGLWAQSAHLPRSHSIPFI